MIDAVREKKKNRETAGFVQLRLKSIEEIKEQNTDEETSYHFMKAS